MKAVFSLLAVFQAARSTIQEAHWTIKGPTFLADHAELGNLYSAFDDEIDTLAEKAVRKYGAGVVDLAQQLKMQQHVCDHWRKQGDLMRRAYDVEMTVLEYIDRCLHELEQADELDTGIDNFLRGVADSHQKATFLLGARLGIEPEMKETK